MRVRTLTLKQRRLQAVALMAQCFTKEELRDIFYAAMARKLGVDDDWDNDWAEGMF